MSTPKSFKHLLSPGRIGSLETRNRIVMSPMGSNLAESNGHVGERIKRYYEERARGGVGLITIGVGAIAFPAGACNPNQVAISDDAFLPGLSDLTRRVHAQGAKVAIQIQHAGKVATQDMGAGRPLWVPSALPPKAGDLFTELTPEEIRSATEYLARPGAKLSFHEMTKTDIERLIALFADAADRARRAGFDGVELHAAHGYILSCFLSPATNKREDEYGGPLENRARLLVEVIQAVKARVGPEFPVWCRLDSKEFRLENGITVEDARRTAEMAEAAGIDAIHVSAYADSTSGVAFTDAPLVHAPCGYVALAEGIKRRVKIPVIAVGRIEPHEAEEIVRTGQADFIAMGRKLLADPELPRKLREGRPEDIRPCIYCYTCVGQIFLNQPNRCGHQVTLCEKQQRLGGTFFFSSLLYEVNGKLVEYLATQIGKLPIDLRLSQEVTPSLVQELEPDVVLVAVGARREAPAIPGVNRANVLSGDDLRSLMTGSDQSVAVKKLSLRQRTLLGMGSLMGVADRISLTRELTRHWMPLGKRVAILGGGLVGIELAEFLAERGREVCVLEEQKTLAVEMAPPRRWRALHELRESGVVLLTEVGIEEINDDGVVYTSKAGEQRTLATDSVILAIGAQENRSLAEALRGLGYELHLIGDCSGVGYVEGAIMDAARIARAI
jgi:2,4-dienoyl-CoA reductase (NADPH2)